MAFGGVGALRYISIWLPVIGAFFVSSPAAAVLVESKDWRIEDSYGSKLKVVCTPVSMTSCGGERGICSTLEELPLNPFEYEIGTGTFTLLSSNTTHRASTVSSTIRDNNYDGVLDLAIGDSGGVGSVRLWFHDPGNTATAIDYSFTLGESNGWRQVFFGHCLMKTPTN